MVKYINNVEELLSMERKGEYELADDIDVNGREITMILGDFSGKLNGAGHVIKNLILTDEIWGDDQTLSLFYSMNRAELSNITFEDIKILYDPTCYKPRVSALAGKCSDCIITNIVMTIENNVDDRIPLIYEANNCMIQNNMYVCNGKEMPITMYS